MAQDIETSRPFRNENILKFSIFYNWFPNKLWNIDTVFKGKRKEYQWETIQEPSKQRFPFTMSIDYTAPCIISNNSVSGIGTAMIILGGQEMYFTTFYVIQQVLVVFVGHKKNKMAVVC